MGTAVIHGPLPAPDMREHFVEGRATLESSLVFRRERPAHVERAGFVRSLAHWPRRRETTRSAHAFLSRVLPFIGNLTINGALLLHGMRLPLLLAIVALFEEAESYFEKSLACWRTLTDPLSTARCLHNLANAAKMRGADARATAALMEATTLFQVLETPAAPRGP